MRQVWLVIGLAACGTPAEDTAAPDGDAGPAGRCSYVNPFSDALECKEYLGSAWTDAAMAEDCNAPIPGADPGQLEAGLACDRTSVLGECAIDAGAPEATTLVFPGVAGADCSGLKLGCTFAGGELTTTELCDDDGGGGGGSTSVFRPFEKICRDPVGDEPAGQGPDGQVCTWQAISGSTEAGRRFEDYADCTVVRTQRPYWAGNIDVETDPADPRLADPAWVAEYTWVTSEVRADACVCCHSSVEVPNGASGWDLEDPIWTDGLDDDGMAVMAGWVDSTVFGAFAAADNNGFDRSRTGAPTTDADRMIAFFAGELFRRGLDREDFADTAPFGGPLYDQLVYEADACGAGIGVGTDGVLDWGSRDARYVYVLTADASPPGAPPNLDLPDGTLWRLDVAWDAAPVASGLAYGEVPEGTSQAWPLDGAPPELLSGETYYLYALTDIYQPLQRCLFEMP